MLHDTITDGRTLPTGSYGRTGRSAFAAGSDTGPVPVGYQACHVQQNIQQIAVQQIIGRFNKSSTAKNILLIHELQNTVREVPRRTRTRGAPRRQC